MQGLACPCVLSEALWLAPGPAGIWCGSERAHSQLCDPGQSPSLGASVPTRVTEATGGSHCVGLPCQRDESAVGEERASRGNPAV